MGDPTPSAALQQHNHNGTTTDIEADATGAASEQTDVQSTRSKPRLQPTTSSIKRDAASYGVDWKPPRQYTFGSPQQVKEKHVKWLKLVGRIGWIAKGIIYALIGGLACENAVGRHSNASPQGAFVLIGTAHGGRGLLVVLAMAIATYSIWRFWEGAVGQGYDNTFSSWRNFFKFRLSPLVSGAVYIAYDVLVIELIPRDNDDKREWASSDAWPNSWHESGIGIFGLLLVGIAFLAAVVVQLEQFVTKSFHNTIFDEFPGMPKRFNKPFRWFVLATGHIGVLGRAGIFLFAAILFFRTIRKENDYNESAFGAAFAQLESTKAGRSALFIMGFFVVVYALFAVLNVYARIFPTPPPSRIRKARAFSGSGGEPPLPPQFGPVISDTIPARTLLPGSRVRGFSPLHDAVAANSQTSKIAANGGANGLTEPPRAMAAVEPTAGSDVELGVPCARQP